MKNRYFTLFFGLLLLVSSSVEAGFIYLGDSGARKIQRANLDGSGLSDLVTGVSTSSYGLAADMGRLFWSGGSGFIIQSANLDGTSVNTVATDSASGDIEILGATIYEADDLFGQIRLFDKNGSGSSFSSVIGGSVLGNISGMTTDGTDLFIFSSGQIIAVDLPSGLGTVIADLGVLGSDLELHDGFFYFGSAGSDSALGGSLWRIALDGTGLTELITSPTNRSVHAISIANNRLYWTELESGTGTKGAVLSANLDGSGKTTLISGLDSPRSLFVTAGTVTSVAEPASAALVLGSLFLGFAWGPGLRRSHRGHQT